MDNKLNRLLAFIFWFSLQVQAQQHVYVYRDSVFAKLDGYKGKYKKLDSLKLIYTQEIQTERAKLQNKYVGLSNLYAVEKGETIDQLKARMNSLDKEKLILLQEEDKLLATRIKSYNRMLEQQFILEIQPYISVVNKAISSYAKKNKVDYVWTMEELQNNLLFANPGKNITKTIADAANKEFARRNL
ncbi:OmpH family outer membrane protein [Flavobacterium humidisoli]|uniref:OmpH family outer membrane protein n=1 Tax=Flavobacterium humidisoli TaxID=2937442 RepID=A0ABY4LXT0_9FLAO|nr:OmpH family outer membrane protein [Flavobacterium humidisoli]UPZ17874.1 OmpH family outer membrane protein [Flavobacterium humidisoli]